MFIQFCKGMFSPSTPHSTALTQWSRIFLEKLTVAQLVQTLTAFYGTRRFITVFTRAQHVSISAAGLILSASLHTLS